jgi:hypothetical protein
MASAILQHIADQLPDVDNNIAELEDLIKVAKEVGRSTIEYQTLLTKLKQERNLWYKMLKNRGLVK